MRSGFAIATMQELAGRRLVLSSPSARELLTSRPVPPPYRLQYGDTTVAVFHQVPQQLGSWVCDADEGSWVFEPDSANGLWVVAGRISVRAAVGHREVAHFQRMARLLQGAVHVAGVADRAYFGRSGAFETRYVITSASATGALVQVAGVRGARSRVTITPDASSLPDLPWLVPLACLLRVRLRAEMAFPRLGGTG